MKTIPPNISIQNTDGERWLISSSDVIATSNGETIAFTVAVPRSTGSVHQLTLAAIRRAIEVLTDAERVASAGLVDSAN